MREILPKTLSVQLIIVFLIVFLSRLPFLYPGYGMDVDGWRLAAAARNISVTGLYGYSRVPGHPFHEIVSAFLWRGEETLINGSTALMSAAAVLFFGLILGKLGSRNIIIPSLAFAFTPVIFINSINSMDYMWALAFVLGSLYFIMEGKALAAGVFLGAAIGCRFTSGIMLMPLIIILFQTESSKKNIIKLLLTSGVTTIILFIPAYLRYGFDFLTGFTNAYAGIGYIISRMNISLWGIAGCIGIFAALIIHLYQVKIRRVKADTELNAGRYFYFSLLSGIALFLLAFSMSPHKAGYLIPIIPLILILLGLKLERKLFYFVCIALTISPFVLSAARLDLDITPEFSSYTTKVNLFGSPVVIDYLKGPIFIDHSRRIGQQQYIDEIIEAWKKITRKSVVAAGESYPFIDVMLPYDVQGKVIYEYLLDSLRLIKYKNEGIDIYYLPGAEKDNLSAYGIDLTDFAEPFVR